jgi:taurine transport system permease protein
VAADQPVVVAYQPDAVFVGIAVIAFCAFGFTLAMRLLEAWLVPWKGKS